MNKPTFVGGPTALYGQLAGIFRSKIRSGEWPDGHTLPTLEEISSHYGVARVTARQAIHVLIGEGLVSSHRGRRTIVTFDSAQSEGASLFGNFGVLETAPNYAVRILSIEPAKQLPISSWYSGDVSGDFVRIRKIDSESGRPYVMCDIYVMTRIYSKFPDGAIERGKVAPVVKKLARPPIVAARERFTVGMADVDEAAGLNYSVGSPMARINRIFMDENDDICYSASLNYRGDLYCHDRDITEYIR